MPIYEFLCNDCAVQFEKTLPVSEALSKQPCPSCTSPVDRILSDFSTTFINHTSKETTGISSLDNNFDRVVGKDSAEKWKIIAAREKEKLEVLKAFPDSAPRDLKRTDSGYEVMPKTESEEFRNNLFKYRVREK